MPFGNGVLVIADLAGAERDKKTGNMVNLSLKLILYIHILVYFFPFYPALVLIIFLN